MSIETAVIKTSKDVAVKGVNVADATIKKVWSILDAASEKEAPSKLLRPQAIRSIQGN